MGRASRKKRERAARRLDFALERAELVIDALDSSPCATCAFTDPEAWIADVEIPTKIADALRTSQPFYCHRLLESDAEGHYLEARRADGQPDPKLMPMCAGFARLMRTAEREGIDRAIEATRRLRRTLLERAIADPPSEPNARDVVLHCRGDVALLEHALDSLAASKKDRRGGRFSCSVDEVSP